ncbi:thiol-disulfide oxidoreductase DCC family protein [Roseovarius salinarum]|uniref:thiol-disulfide oxidoreductase DCC family protein n=1 Tax=Roseovarius salinarum TaxID=1981892 RepID=UPI000C3375E2|nr:DUF393 domain-containing protein [Roseovarius salinarum]
MTGQTRVLYNGACPVCRAEIDHYARYRTARGLPIVFDDLNRSDTAAWGISKEDAARRLHVRHEDRIYSGFPAFLLLWQQMPRYRPLAKVAGLPGFRHVAAGLYDRVLAPALYARHRRRMQRGA